MSRANRELLLPGLLAALAIAWFSLRQGRPQPVPPASDAAASSSSLQSSIASAPPEVATGPAPRPNRLIGETILQDYANPAMTPEHDLALMAQLMQNFTLLVKGAALRPLSANEDWARALRGLNLAQERFLPEQHVALNSKGQLVDRWGTPLFFHSVGRGEFQIRSAGPDRRLWTADDLQRNANGSFHRGAALTPSNLQPNELTGHP